MSALDDRLAAVVQRRAAAAGPRPQRHAVSKALLQRVYAGLEYTEWGSQLYHLPGNAATSALGRDATANIGGTSISLWYLDDPTITTELAFIDPLTAATSLADNSDNTLLEDGRVKLTNDVSSPEWVVMGHATHGVNPGTMLANMTQDIGAMFQLRDDLAHEVDAAATANAGSYIVLGQGTHADLQAAVAAEGLFLYKPKQNDRGKAQITVQYERQDTIRRITELNASKFLVGSKVEEGDDVARVTGRMGWGTTLADRAGRTSYSRASAVLLPALINSSDDVVANGAVELTAAEVGLIKLMVINDAMAGAMTFHKAGVGQAQEKNIQRFFPKSRRDEYVRAVAQANVTNTGLGLLRTKLNVAAHAMAQLVWQHSDPSALRIDEAFGKLGGAAGPLRQTRQRLAEGKSTTQQSREDLKDAVLGAGGARLEKWIRRAALAYTDTSAPAPPGTLLAGHHRAGGTRLNVMITSAGLTPVAGPAGAPPRGAVYEFREREIWMGPGDTQEVVDALRELLGVA